jgi:hypothetical protein
MARKMDYDEASQWWVQDSNSNKRAFEKKNNRLTKSKSYVMRDPDPIETV